MERIKQLKTESLLSEAISEAIANLADTRIRSLLVTRTEISNGKESAKIFLDKTGFEDLDSQKEILALLKRANGAIRAALKASLSWYKTPQLTFIFDDSLEFANRLDDIFRAIHKNDSQDDLLESERENEEKND